MPVKLKPQTSTFVLLLALALGLAACGPRSRNMDGAQAGGEGEVGEVDDSAQATPTPEESPETASFNADEEPVEMTDEVIVRRGENLWNIARRKNVYRSGWLYPLIYKANKSKLQDPDKIEVGTVLRIPRNASAAEREIAKEEAMTGRYRNLTLSAEPLVASGAVSKAAAAQAKAPEKKSGGKLGKVLVVGALLAGGAWWWRRRKLAQAV